MIRKTKRQKRYPYQRRGLKKALFNRDGCFCMIGDCCWPLTMQDATIDHIKPLSKGGPDTIGNMQLACKGCNHEKGNKYDG